MAISSIDDGLRDIREGKMVIIVDDEDRENEGDVMIPAEKVTPEAVTFMARYACGLICLSLTEKRVRELKLPLMVENNTSQYKTAFTVSIEAKQVLQPVFPPMTGRVLSRLPLMINQQQMIFHDRATSFRSWRERVASLSG